jgi:hypothetical protein
MVQGDTEFASIVMLNLVQHLVITDYGMNRNFKKWKWENELTSHPYFVSLNNSKERVIQIDDLV